MDEDEVTPDEELEDLDLEEEEEGEEDDIETEDEGEEEEEDSADESVPVRQLREALGRRDKKVKTLEKQIKALQEQSSKSEKINSNVEKALRMLAGKDEEAEAPESTIPDPVEDPEGWAEHQQKMNESGVQAAREEGKKAGQESYRAEKRMDMSNTSASAFAKEYPAIGKPDVWDKHIKPLVTEMHHRQLGTGPDGTVTRDDILGIAYRYPKLRAHILTKQKQNKDSDIISGLKDAADSKPARGAVNLDELSSKSPEEIMEVLKREGFNSQKAAAILDDLPDDVVDKLEL